MNRDEFFEFQTKAIVQFYIYYRGYKSISKNLERINKNRTYWVMTNNVYLEHLFLEWCKIFGAFSNDTHWHNNHTENEITEFRDLILKTTNLNEEEWSKYHESMMNFRNNYVAHTIQDYNSPVPYLKHAFSVMRVYEDWIKNIFKSENILYMDDYYEHVNVFQEELLTVLNLSI